MSPPWAYGGTDDLRCLRKRCACYSAVVIPSRTVLGTALSLRSPDRNTRDMSMRRMSDQTRSELVIARTPLLLPSSATRESALIIDAVLHGGIHQVCHSGYRQPNSPVHSNAGTPWRNSRNSRIRARQVPHGSTSSGYSSPCHVVTKPRRISLRRLAAKRSLSASWGVRSGGRSGGSRGACFSCVFMRARARDAERVVSVDAEWIVAEKDWQEAKKKQKARGLSMETPAVDGGNAHQELPPQYQPEMDEMRCILYAHGGTLANSCLGLLVSIEPYRRILFREHRPRKVCWLSCHGLR